MNKFRPWLILSLFMLAGGFLSPVVAQQTDSLQLKTLLDSTSLDLTTALEGKKGIVLSPDNVPLPFAIVTAQSGEVITVADVNGVFLLPKGRRGRRQSLQVYHPDFEPVPLAVKFPVPDTLLVRLTTSRSTEFADGPLQGRAIIQKVMENRNRQDLNVLPGFTYKSYNKFMVNVDRQPLRKYVPRFIRKRLPFLVPPGDRNYHLYLMETVTRRDFRKEVQDRETILATRATGINDPTLFAPVTQIQPLNIFDEYLHIVTTDFVGPLSPKTINRYRFSLVETFPQERDTLYIVHFEPQSNRKFEGLEGFLYINSLDFSIQNLMAVQAGENSLSTQIYQSFQATEAGFHFPSQIRTVAAYRSLSNRELQFFGTYSSYLDSLQILPPQVGPEKQFDEILVRAVPEAGLRPEAYWQNNRMVSLSPMNLYTQEFYDSLDVVKDFDRYLRLIQKVMTTTVPFKFVDVKLKYLFRYNEYEGIRPGLGLQTNEQLSRRFDLLGWVGYGFRDAGFKYGSALTVYADPLKETSVSLLLQKEVEESGTPNFAFDRRQYSSELIRQYRVRLMDMINERRLTVQTQAFPHFAYAFSLSDNTRYVASTYRFQDNPRQPYSFFEVGLGLRFAYKEKFVMTPNRKVSVGSTYPIAWFHLTQGLRGVMNGQFNYAKIDAKVEQSWRLLFKGITTAQLIGGTVLGQVPYSILYNGNGAYAFASVVIHNSFETMAYNEFLNSHYASLFISHNFGKLLVRKGDFNPDLELLHNMGIGGLAHPGDHQNINFKTMNRGYFESGFFVNDIYQFTITVAKVGLGAGFFYRYGPYAHDKFHQNLYFKFSTRLSL